MNEVYERSKVKPYKKWVIVAWKKIEANVYECHMVYYSQHFNRWLIFDYPHYYEFDDFEWWQKVGAPPDAENAYFVPEKEDLE